MSVNISATFSKEAREYCGLDAITADLIEFPHDRVYVVGVVEVLRITKDIADGGVETPTVRFVQIEAVDDGDVPAVRKLLDGRYQDRTGKDHAAPDTLPIGDEGPVAERPRDEWLDPEARED